MWVETGVDELHMMPFSSYEVREKWYSENILY
jgi:hypothetical protein